MEQSCGGGLIRIFGPTFPVLAERERERERLPFYYGEQVIMADCCCERDAATSGAKRALFMAVAAQFWHDFCTNDEVGYFKLM